MNHKVTNVTKLHEDAYALYNNVVLADADTILDNLYVGIDNLQKNWKGKDAGVQIQYVVEVYNAMVVIRNALAEFAVDSSKVAAGYREIQNTNGAGLEDLSVLSYDAKTTMSSYSDVSDTIDINSEANTGKSKIETARDSIETFMGNAETYYNAIRENWTAGTGVEAADSAFSSFKSTVTKHQQTLASVAANVATALSNYSI